MQAAGLKTLRIFITEVAQNIKGCANSAVNDVEVGTPGNWDDTILGMIDTLISEAMPRGIKLIIAPHDRYALGMKIKVSTDATWHHSPLVFLL